MQQYLPLAVLKPHILGQLRNHLDLVATVLTACGIETHNAIYEILLLFVATVLTACGIETEWHYHNFHALSLQQYLPFTVLKLHGSELWLHKLWIVAIVPIV